MKKLKRALIKEEYVELTGSFISALILQQFLYWTDRMDDVDTWIKEETIRQQKEKEESYVEFPQSHGWIYKTAEDLNGELMLGMSPPTIRKYLKALIDIGVLSERQNPKYKWDKTLQYRVNLSTLSRLLQEMGYYLEGYRNIDSLLTKNNKATNQNGLATRENTLAAIPETTTETTTKSKSLKEMQREEKALPAKSKKRKSLKGLSRAEVINLYNNDKSEPPRGYTRPQVLAAILDHTKGMNDIVNEIGWSTIMMRLGQLFNRRRKVLLEYRDFMDVAIGLTEIPRPENGKASIDYLVGMLTRAALELHIKRAEQEAQQYKTDKVEEIISDLANKMRMDI